MRGEHGKTKQRSTNSSPKSQPGQLKQEFRASSKFKHRKTHSNWLHLYSAIIYPYPHASCPDYPLLITLRSVRLEAIIIDEHGNETVREGLASGLEAGDSDAG